MVYEPASQAVRDVSSLKYASFFAIENLNWVRGDFDFKLRPSVMTESQELKCVSPNLLVS